MLTIGCYKCLFLGNLFLRYQTALLFTNLTLCCLLQLTDHSYTYKFYKIIKMNSKNMTLNIETSVVNVDNDDVQPSNTLLLTSNDETQSNKAPQHELKKFANEKKQTLEKMDKSVKGEIDAPIVFLVEMINNHCQYYTTSSCSGRIIVTATNNQDDAQKVIKKGTDWKFVSHETVDDADTLVKSIIEAKNDDKAYNSMVLKFEPVIFHIRAINIEAANGLLQVALQSGFRNSGIVLGANGRATVAIRHTAGLEVPLIIDGEMAVQESYLRQIAKVANLKMVSNFKAINRLETAIKTFLIYPKK